MGLKARSSPIEAFLESLRQLRGIRASSEGLSNFVDLDALLVLKDASHCSLHERCLQRHTLEDSNQKS